MEPVEAAPIRHEAGPLGLEHLPDRLVAHLRMGLDPGPGDALIGEPVVELLQALFTRTRGENSRSRIVPTWFSTWPFSQPEAGVQATGSTR